MVWLEKRAGVYDVFAQLLDTAGYRQWDTLGVKVGSTNSGDGQEVAAVGDSGTGCIVVWPTHSDSTGSWDVYAQRADSAGQLRWGTLGLGVAVDSGMEKDVYAATDTRGGAVVMWGRSYAGESLGLCVQRIGDATGITDVSHLCIGELLVLRNPARRILEFRWPAPGPEKVVIHDVGGRLVTLVQGRRCAASCQAVWDGRDCHGARCPTGTYICTLRDGASIRASKVLLIAD